MPRVEILAMFGGADGSLLRYAVDQGAKGIVVRAVGMGNMNVSMFEAVKYALSKNVPVVVPTPLDGFEPTRAAALCGCGNLPHCYEQQLYPHLRRAI
jgi:hypothetical protein